MARYVAVLMVIFVSGAGFASAEKLPFTDGDSLDVIRQKIEHNGYAFTVTAYKSGTIHARGRHPSQIRLEKSGNDIGPLADYLDNPPTESSFSWLNVNGDAYIGPIRDQGQCGSCYAFAATAAAEGTFNVATGLVNENCADFSEGFLAFCMPELPTYYDHFAGCGGADYEYMELEALSVAGICNESVLPYTLPDISCDESTWSAPRTRFASWHRIACGDIDAIKTAIRHFGAVDAAVLCTSAFDAYAGGVYEDTNTACTECEYTLSNHAIALVGWDDNPPEGGGGCWILRNSWGAWWGEGGYMRIRYTSAGVACAVCYLVYDAQAATEPQPPYAGTKEIQTSDPHGATLQGVLLTQGEDTQWHFEYGLDDTYGFETATVTAADSPAPQTVTAPVAELGDGTVYHFRLVAENVNGTSNGEDRQFETYDVTPPVFELMSVDPPEACRDQIVSIVFTCSEPLGERPVVKVNGKPAVSQNQGKRPRLAYTYKIARTDAVGPATIEITGYDVSGNPGVLSVSGALSIVHGVPLRAWPLVAVLALLGIVTPLRRLRE